MSLENALKAGKARLTVVAKPKEPESIVKLASVESPNRALNVFQIPILVFDKTTNVLNLLNSFYS